MSASPLHFAADFSLAEPLSPPYDSSVPGNPCSVTSAFAWPPPAYAPVHIDIIYYIVNYLIFDTDIYKHSAADPFLVNQC